MERKYWIQLAFAITIIFIGILGSVFKRHNLNTCSKQVKAVIVDKYRIKSRGYFIKYSYYVEEKKYESSESIKRKKEIDAFRIGDTITINYSCTFPDFSKFKEL